MIKTIVDLFQAQIQALPFVGNYGGLVRVITQNKVIDEKTGATKRIVFPVTCNAPSDCWKHGFHRAITPDSRNKSIFYFETVQEPAFVKYDGPKMNRLLYSGKIRLVGWLNLPKLGFEKDCSIDEGIFYADFMEMLPGRYSIGGNFASSMVQIGEPSIVPKERVFSSYTYSDVSKNLLYPYVYFALDFPLAISINKLCLVSPTIAAPVDCVIV